MCQNLINRLETISRDSGRHFDAEKLRRAFLYKRRVTARRFSNLSLLNIAFITFRHWAATMEYHRTKDVLYAMKSLGHKNIKNTLVYTELTEFKDYGYTLKVAKTVEEASQLIESGFESVCGYDGDRIFRNRK